MQVICMRFIISLCWGISVSGHTHDSRIRTNVTPNTYDISVSHSKWQRSGSGITDGVDGVMERVTGVHTWGIVRTAAGKSNATLFKKKRASGREHTRSLNHQRETANSRSGIRRDSRGHRMENFRFGEIAAMETPGGDYMPPKHPFMSHQGGHKRGSHRRKRGALDSRKKSGRKNPWKSPELDALLESSQAMWEPVPRPLALNLSTDFPFDETEDFDLTFPDDRFRGPTPLIPLNTRKANNLRNPFYPLTSESYGAYAIVCVSVIIFVAGILGNIVIMCIVCHNYYMRSISNSLLANLALWDFVMVFFCLPLVVFHELTKTWLLGELSCKIIPYIEVTSLGVTTFTLCALCIDRFRAATNVQMYYEMMESCGSTSAKLAVIWVGALLLAVPELLLRQMVKEEGEGAGPRERCVVRVSTELPDTVYVLGLTYDGARLWWFFGCYFCLPTLFTIGSSLATARKIQRAERACARGNKKQIRLESQMNCTVVALAILYGLCVVPENICNIVSAYMAAGVAPRSLELLQLVSQLLLFCRAAATPVLLLCLCRPFGRAFLDCCCCCCSECGPAPSSAAASDDNDRECTTELELSPFSTMRRETSACAAAGTHC